MSRLSDQVESKIVRANRAFRLSSRVIAAAHRELESHGTWLDRHRVTWAEEVKRHHRLLKRKLAMRATMRTVVGLVFAAPLALAQKLAALAFRSTPQPHAPWEDPAFTRHTALQLRIRRLDERSRPARVDADATRPGHGEAPRASRASSEGKAPLTRAPSPRSHAGRVPAPAVGALALFIVVAGVLRAIFSSEPSEELAVTTQVLPEAKSPAAPAALTVVQPVTASMPAEQPEPASGFAVLEAPPSIDAPRTHPETVADMVAMAAAEPPSSPSVEVEVAPAPLAEKPLPPKQAAKPKPRRKLAAREPQPLPWWQQWSWIRVR